MLTPFEKFFEHEFERQQDRVVGEPGLFSDGGSIREASWDRKAAYLLWVALGRPGKPKFDFGDLL